MESKLAQSTLAHVLILASGPAIQKDPVDKLRVRQVETSSYEEATGTSTDTTRPIPLRRCMEWAYLRATLNRTFTATTAWTASHRDA